LNPQVRQLHRDFTSVHHESGASDRQLLESSHPKSLQQFAKTPRFAVPRRINDNSKDETAHLHHRASPSNSLRTTVPIFQQNESIEDVRFDPNSDEGPLRSEEISFKHGDEEEMLLDPRRPPTKKRRISSSSSRISDVQTPNASSSPMLDERSSHKFVIAPSKSPHQRPGSSHSDPPVSPGKTKPTFVVPSISPSRPRDFSNPLPDAFSPHKRGQKFVPGGMADTVRGWIVDVAAAIGSGRAHSRTTSRNSHNNQRFKIEIETVVSSDAKLQESGAYFAYPGSCVLVEGHVYDLQSNQCCGRTQVVLPVQNSYFRNSAPVQRGTVVGISNPAWTIEISKQEWLVAVDWEIL
jgi:hypothetical protein